MMELPNGQISRPTDPDSLVLEAWDQGLMVGSLIIMAAVILANMKGQILLHKLILIELLLAIPYGTFIFNKPPPYGWHLSVSAVALNLSLNLDNRVSIPYITTALLVQPYLVLEIYANFTHFNNINRIFQLTRPLKPLFRDLWWICMACSLFYAVKCSYNFGIVKLVTVSPRLGTMLASMCLSIGFIIVDTCSVLGVFDSASLPLGVQPFWKLSLIFKCLCNTVILDDFKTALDGIRAYRQQLQEHIHPSNCGIYPANRRPSLSGSACQLTLEDEEGVFRIGVVRATRRTA
ncbi:hypothetical protein BDV11DRAFT_209417 [Aspergillus similis]